MTKLVTTARKLPGLLVGTSLQAARLPLTAAAKATGQSSNEEWPPALMFEGVEAAVETTVGGLLRDDTLVSRGRLRQARLTKLKEAAGKQAAEKRREQVEEPTEQREQRLQQEAAKRKQQVAKTAAERKAATAKQTAAQRKVVERQERDAKLAAAEAESKALSKEKAALVAEDTTVALDEAIDVNREARTGS
jgi:flagellar biosynthesis GTPase FlhF